MKIWPMAELARRRLPRFHPSFVKCEISIFAHSLWDDARTLWSSCVIHQTKRVIRQPAIFFLLQCLLRSWCHRAWESSQRGDLRGNCQRVWDGVTNSPLILMTGKSTEARTRCARASVSWEAWVVNWTLKSQTVKQQNELVFIESTLGACRMTPKQERLGPFLSLCLLHFFLNACAALCDITKGHGYLSQVSDTHFPVRFLALPSEPPHFHPCLNMWRVGLWFKVWLWSKAFINTCRMGPFPLTSNVYDAVTWTTTLKFQLAFSFETSLTWAVLFCSCRSYFKQHTVSGKILDGTQSGNNYVCSFWSDPVLFLSLSFSLRPSEEESLSAASLAAVVHQPERGLMILFFF